MTVTRPPVRGAAGRGVSEDPQAGQTGHHGPYHAQKKSCSPDTAQGVALCFQGGFHFGLQLLQPFGWAVRLGGVLAADGLALGRPGAGAVFPWARCIDPVALGLAALGGPPVAVTHGRPLPVL